MSNLAKSEIEPVVKVKIHKSPPMSTPRNPPSPGMIPAFSYELEPSAESER